jgi:hypothetical protein
MTNPNASVEVKLLTSVEDLRKSAEAVYSHLRHQTFDRNLQTSPLHVFDTSPPRTDASQLPSTISVWLFKALDHLPLNGMTFRSSVIRSS